ncbi:MAG TPA: hypothetical protein VF371_05255 [Candidatus Limnocylindrales bacterium]
MTGPPGNPSRNRPSRYARPATPPATPGPTSASYPPETSDQPAPSETAGTPRLGRHTPASRRLRAFATIARLAGPPAALALVATVALVIALATLRGVRTAAVNAWLLSIGALMLWTCWRVLTAALPAAADSAFDSVRSRPAEQPSTLPEVIAIEGVLIDAEWSWRGVEYRLRPLLRKIAAARLAERHQVDLVADPAAAQQVLGPELWALVGPGPYGPTRAATPDRTPTDAARSGAETYDGLATEPAGPRHRRGIPRATIRRAIDLLEAL